MRIVCCGRRWGKSFLGTWLCVEAALQGGTTWWVAPDYPRTQPGWEFLQHFARQCPEAAVNLADRIVLIATGTPVKVIQERLGHSSFSTTMNIYGHLLDGMDRAAADALDAVLTG